MLAARPLSSSNPTGTNGAAGVAYGSAESSGGPLASDNTPAGTGGGTSGSSIGPGGVAVKPSGRRGESPSTTVRDNDFMGLSSGTRGAAAAGPAAVGGSLSKAGHSWVAGLTGVHGAEPAAGGCSKLHRRWRTLRHNLKVNCEWVPTSRKTACISLCPDARLAALPAAESRQRWQPAARALCESQPLRTPYARGLLT